MKWLYPKDDGNAIEADDELIEVCGTLKAIKAEAKALDARIEPQAAKIKARMGAAASLLGPNGKPIATWKTNKDSAATDWKAACLDLKPTAEHLARFTTTKPGARPFLIK